MRKPAVLTLARKGFRYPLILTKKKSGKFSPSPEMRLAVWITLIQITRNGFPINYFLQLSQDLDFLLALPSRSFLFSIYVHLKCQLPLKIWNLLTLTRVLRRTGSRDGMRWRPYIWRSMNNKDAGRSSLMRHQWNETKWMRWVWRNVGMKFVVGVNGINPQKTFPGSDSSPRNLHGLTEVLGTPAVEGERLIASTKILFKEK